MSAYANRASAWSEEKNFDKALADYNKAIDIDPSVGYLYGGRGRAYSEKKEYLKARFDFEEAADIDPSADHLNAVAWLLSTCPDDQIRNPRKALRFAERAIRLSESDDKTAPGRHPRHAGRRLAAIGKFKEAVRTPGGSPGRPGFRRRPTATRAGNGWSSTARRSRSSRSDFLPLPALGERAGVRGPSLAKCSMCAMLSGIPRDSHRTGESHPESMKRRWNQDPRLFACFRGGTRPCLRFARDPRKHGTRRHSLRRGRLEPALPFSRRIIVPSRRSRRDDRSGTGRRAAPRRRRAEKPRWPRSRSRRSSPGNPP